MGAVLMSHLDGSVPMAAFSHVIFDLDGTILNTLEDLAAAGNHTCETHGWPTFAVDEYRYKVGNGMLKLVERFMPAEYAATAVCLSRRSPSLGLTTASTRRTTPPPMPAQSRCSTPARRRCAACRAHQQGPRLGGSAYREVFWFRTLCAGTGPCRCVSAQARSTRHAACDGGAGRRSGNHALCGRFQCRYPDRPQRRP